MDLRLVRVLVKIFLIRLGNLPDAIWLKSWLSDDKLDRKKYFPTVAKIEFVRPKQQEKPVRKPVKYAEMPKVVNTARPNSAVVNDVRANQGHPQKEDQGYADSGCSRHMTGNMSYLSDFKEFDGGYVTFGGGAKGGKITGKGTLKTGSFDFDDVMDKVAIRYDVLTKINEFSVPVVAVPAGSVVPTGKDNSIVSTGSTKVIPAGRNKFIPETKQETILLQSLPEDHMAYFHHLDDARDIWLPVKARFGGNDESKKMRKSMLKQEFSEFRVSESEGLHKGYDRFQKILSQLNQMQAKPDNEDCKMKRSLLKILIDWKMDLEELDIKWQMAMLSIKINRFEKKAGRKMKFNNKDAARWIQKQGTLIQLLGARIREKKPRPCCLLILIGELGQIMKEEDVEIGVCSKYIGMIAVSCGGCLLVSMVMVDDDVSNDAAEFALMGISSQVQTCPFGCEHLYAELKKEFDNVEAQYKECYIQVQAYKSTLQTLEQQKGWYQAKVDNLNDKVKLEESNARFDKWKESSKNLVKLINSSMSSRSRFGLGFGDTFGSDEVFDLSAPSIFDSPLRIYRGNLSMYSLSKLLECCLTSPQTQRPLTLHPVFQVSSPQAPRPMNPYSSPYSGHRQTSVPAGSRNRPTSVPASSRNRQTSVPAGSRNKPTSVPAGRPVSAGWKNNAAQPMTRPTSHYFS
ncbi:hypothetical protein Tco_1276443 [Tanacetum coccineum]